MLLDKEFMYHEMFVDIYGRQIDSFYIRKFRNYFRESKNCTAPLCIKRYVWDLIYEMSDNLYFSSSNIYIFLQMIYLTIKSLLNHTYTPVLTRYISQLMPSIEIHQRVWELTE